MKNLRVIVAVFFLIAFLGALPAYAGKPDPKLHKAQSLLLELGYHPGPADGRMGKKTRFAIKKFQHDHGMPESGILDDRTLQKLKDQSAKKDSPGADQKDKGKTQDEPHPKR